MQKPLITVVVPCFNAEKHIYNSLLSLRNQTYPNLQIITVNDGSRDNTLKILNRNASKDARFEVYESRKAGVSGARNTGIEKARGEFITFLDCDDIISPYHVENLYNLMTEHNADLAVCSYKRKGKKAHYGKHRFKEPKNKKPLILDRVESTKYFLAQKNFDFCVWNKMYSTKILKENDIWFREDCRFNEDTLFNYKYIKHVNKSVYTKSVTHYYVQTKNSLVRQGFYESRLDAYISLNGIINDAYQNFPEVIDYAHAIRVTMSCDILFFIKLSKYPNPLAIKKIIEYTEEDVKHLKKCKHVAHYRRTLIPLVPGVAKMLLCRRLKNDKSLYVLPTPFEK